jgi:hypothetical protein
MKKKRESARTTYGDDHEDDADGAGGLVATDLEVADPVDDGHQNYGEEGADVEDLELFRELPGEAEEEDGEEEEDVAADGCGSL